MRFEFLENIESEHERYGFTYAAGVIGLSVLALVALFINGFGAIFFMLAVLAIALGFYLAWHVSHEPQQGARGAKRRGRK